MDESYAYRQMQAAEIVKALPNGRVPSEAVARELAPLKGDPAAMREAWEGGAEWLALGVHGAAQLGHAHVEGVRELPDG